MRGTRRNILAAAAAVAAAGAGAAAAGAAVPETCAADEVLKGVPVIDLTPLSGPANSTAYQEVVAAVGKAAREWGFFQVVNHGVPPELIHEFEKEARSFFRLPEEVKEPIKRTKTNAWGYYDEEFTKQTLDWKKGFDFGHVPHPHLPADHPDNVVLEGHNLWPDPNAAPHFRPIMEAYYSVMAKLSARLMGLLALSLGLPQEIFAPDFSRHTSFLRLNHYPPCPQPAEHLAVNRHTDAGALTVLLQQHGITSLQVNRRGRSGCGSGGEQVCDGGRDQWVSIEPVEGAFTVNVGDQLQVWSNDLYVAPEHRVLAHAKQERISAPFFYNPNYEAQVRPMDLCQACGAQPRFSTVTWGEFRRKRFEGDYADVGTEVQIEHFRLHPTMATT